MAESFRQVGRKHGGFMIKLNRVQETVVGSTHQEILVSAGAGTGKTRVLVERFLHLIQSGKAMTQEILALTFTDKAANEMKVRIMDSLQNAGNAAARRSLESAYIMTFHAFAARLLKEHPIEAAIDPDFLVAEEDETELLKEQALDAMLDQAALEKEVFDFLKIYSEKELRSGIEKIYQAAVTEGLRPQAYLNAIREHGPEDIYSARIETLLEELGDEKVSAGWTRFEPGQEWCWETAGLFKDWYINFGRRKKEEWKELKACSEKYRAYRMGLLGRPYKAVFEKLFLDFDARYQTLKSEKALLDFNDLELKLLELFEKDRIGNRKIRERYQKQFKYVMVDEFQDTNAVQSRILELLKSSHHLFVVGDYKQSIYGFRGTSPAHFLEKIQKSKNQKQSLSIAMNENFRSAPGVLDFINQFFGRLWEDSPQIFEPLHAPESKKSEPASSKVEIWSIPTEDKENVARGRMREAGAIAAEIKRLHEDEKVAYGDMVILFRAMSVSAIYEQALKRQGIPYFAVSSRGFYHQSEIKDMMNLLSVLENPLLDIPLAGVLRSPIFQVSDDSLLALSLEAKRHNRNAPLYEGFQNFEQNSEIEASEKTKLQEALKFIRRFSEKKDRLRLAELIAQILEESGYWVRILADPMGIRKYANLQKLMDLARAAENYERVRIRDFIRKVKKLENKEVRESEAQIEAEKSGKVLRLMSVHKAKGLEFPVVFIADTTHQNQTPESKMFLTENGAGYDFEMWDPEESDWQQPLGWTLLEEAKKSREKDEMKRLLYVAMTRAKQRLIMTGVFKPRKEEKDSIEKMGHWGDWLQAFKSELSEWAEYKEITKDSYVFSSPVPAEKKIFRKLIETLTPEPVEKLIPDKTALEAAQGRAGLILSQLNPPSRKPLRAIDLPVSAYAAFSKNPQGYWNIYEKGVEIAEKNEEKMLEESAASLNAADFGTKMHEVLEHLDFHRSEESSSRVLNEVFRGTLDMEKQEAARLLNGFLKSTVFQEIEKSSRVYREIPFILNERHGRLNGVIDLLFQDSSGKWVVLDYKTAHGNESQVKERGYREQILIYAWAVYQLTGLVPDKGILYFFKNQWQYAIPLNRKELESFGAELKGMQDGILAMYQSQAITETL